MTKARKVRLCGLLGCFGIYVLAGLAITPALAQSPPPIRLSDTNRMPSCVTTARLMAFVRERNPRLDPRYDEIAKWYKVHGENWRVRWDYAFFQMIIETNYLMFRAGNGRQGDVSPKQNNFAGIGTTGGGVPGDGYPDVSTGVLAQIQHLVAYSGERMQKPVAPRTQLKQDDIIAVSVRLRRPVTYGDLAGRWAVDRRYARSIESVAERFRNLHCNGSSPAPDDPLPKAVIAEAPRLVKRPIQLAVRPVSASALRPAMTSTGAPETSTAPRVAAPGKLDNCGVQTASYVGTMGSRKTVLIQAVVGSQTQLTALQVLDGFERSMADNYIRSRAPGGVTVAEFATNAAALDHAYKLCPAAR